MSVRSGADEPDGGEGAGHPVGDVGVGGRRQDHRAGPALREPVDDLVDVGGRRHVAGRPVGVEVPADRLGPEDVALEAELRLADRDLLLVVEPGGGDVPLAGEDQDLDHRQPAADGVLVEQAGRGDRAVVGVRAEHHQRAVGPIAWRSASRMSSSWP